MKLKRLPEDFQVEELPAVEPTDSGPFTFYRLTKRNLGTPEAIEAIRARWRLGNAPISVGGMKDRHALTVQYLTIANGPSRPLRQENLELQPIGRLDHPYGSEHTRGNRFGVVVRDLTAERAEEASRAAGEIAGDGLPNYFDDQRFGSVGASGEFIAEAWLRDDPERALFLALAEPVEADRPEAKREKALLREHWGNWTEIGRRLGHSRQRVVVAHLLENPGDHAGAFARINRELRWLYLNAFQSHLWNRLLGRLIDQETTPEQRVLVEFKTAKLPIHRHLDPARAESLRVVDLPLPTARTPAPEGRVGELAGQVLAPLGLRWQDLKVRHLKDVFLSKGLRPALVFPERLEWTTEADDLHDGRTKLRLVFDLPRGSYATVLVKRVTEAP